MNQETKRLSSKLLDFAITLIGKKDAESWYENHIVLFQQPQFTEELILFLDSHLMKMMQKLGFDETTTWAHTHPDWHHSFGVYIVRKGTDIVYEGRSAQEVEKLLGIKIK